MYTIFTYFYLFLLIFTYFYLFFCTPLMRKCFARPKMHYLRPVKQRVQIISSSSYAFYLFYQISKLPYSRIGLGIQVNNVWQP